MTVLFYVGLGAAAASIAGLGLACARMASIADENLQRALRQERAARAGVHVHSSNVTPSPQRPPAGADAPGARLSSSRAGRELHPRHRNGDA